MYATTLWSGFHFSEYELGMFVLGLTMLLGVLIPQWTLKRFYTFPLIFMAMGALLFGLSPSLRIPIPFASDSQVFWEKLTEAVVVISLVGAGLKIDQRKRHAWLITARLLLITMPICIGLMAWLGASLLALSLPTALLLGAILAPTDPVLAGDLQVGPPNQGDGNRVRFALTSEAGLNDGLAFPFVYLAIAVATWGMSTWHDWGSTWLLRDVIYRIGMAALMGYGLGRLMGKIIYYYPKHAPLANSSMGVLALCLFFVVYGATELLGGYGFIAAFLGAFFLRREAYRHEYNNTLFVFTENLEHAITVFTLFLLGGLAVSLWPYLTLHMWLFALVAILLIRPFAGGVAMIGCSWPRLDHAVISFYGIRGLGSIYYLAYASNHATFTGISQVWGVVMVILICSAVIHGLSAIPVMRKIDQSSTEF